MFKWLKKLVSFDPTFHEPEEAKKEVIKEIVIPVGTLCDCGHRIDMEIIDAKKIVAYRAMKEYCDKKGIGYTREGSSDAGFAHFSFQYLDISFVAEVPFAKTFSKKACISCKTCLGWHLSDVKSLSPEEYFDDLFQETVKIEKENADKLKLAKEICEIDKVDKEK